MEIHRLSLLDGAKKARGLTVIIDVFRAFTTAAYVMNNGAKRIIPVETVEEAFQMKRNNPKVILMGERSGKQVHGFDYGNSPHNVRDIDFTGQTIVQSTSAGTQGLVAAKEAEKVLPGSFVMADAIVDYIKKENPKLVSLVAMGWGGRVRSPEDENLSKYIEMKLNNLNPDFDTMKKEVRKHDAGAKFFDKTQNTFVEGDFHAAMDLNRFDFCLKLVVDNPPYMVKT